jgi:Uma2 family endonuclease
MSTQAVPYLSSAEYLVIERRSETKHEFYRGEMFAMAGATREHNLITMNIAVSLGNQLRDRPCETYASDMRVKVEYTGLYTYPDIVVTCDKPRFEDEHDDTLLNPQLIVEVLSDSTENYARGKKFELYRGIESLKDYVLVAQNEPHVEVYSRDESGRWFLTEAKGLDSTIELPAIACELKLAEVYARIEFAEVRSTD